MPRFKVLVATVVASALVASTADGQIIGRRVTRTVQNWAGASIGLLQNFGVVDGSTGSSWEFGSGLEYAARFEHPIRSNELAIGLQASFARLPLTYSSASFNGEAKASVKQLLGVIRYGAGYSFHPIYELSVGLIGFSGFRSTGTTEMSLSNSTDYDPKISIGYGFGFGLSSSAEINIVQELGTILHQRDGLAASASNYPRIVVTRIGGKIAF